MILTHLKQHMNDDQINATNQHYVELRNKARKEGDEAHRYVSAYDGRCRVLTDNFSAKLFRGVSGSLPVRS